MQTVYGVFALVAVIVAVLGAPLDAARKTQDDIDQLTANLGDEVRLLRAEYAIKIELWESKRLEAMDREGPNGWSRRLQASPHFWKQAYWRPMAQQRTTTPDDAQLQHSDRWGLIAVDDETFLTEGLTQLRCNRRVADDGERVVEIVMAFTDAPGSVFPFTTTRWVKQFPLSMAHRFHAISTTDPVNEEGTTAGGTGGGAGHRHIVGVPSAPSTEAEFSYSVTVHAQLQEESGENGSDASQKRSRRTWVPSLDSMFSLFAAPSFVDDLTDTEWKRFQLRWARLIDDICFAVHSDETNLDDGTFVVPPLSRFEHGGGGEDGDVTGDSSSSSGSESGSASAAGDGGGVWEAIDHDATFQQWEQRREPWEEDADRYSDVASDASNWSEL